MISALLVAISATGHYCSCGKLNDLKEKGPNERLRSLQEVQEMIAKRDNERMRNYIQRTLTLYVAREWS